jgi:hypothetical protein
LKALQMISMLLMIYLLSPLRQLHLHLSLPVTQSNLQDPAVLEHQVKTVVVKSGSVLVVRRAQYTRKSILSTRSADLFNEFRTFEMTWRDWSWRWWWLGRG